MSFVYKICQLGCDSISHLGYNLFWNDYKKKRQHGIAIHKSPDIVIDTIVHQSEKLMTSTLLFMAVRSKWYWLMPQLKKNAVLGKEKFYKGLNKICIVEKKKIKQKTMY